MFCIRPLSQLEQCQVEGRETIVEHVRRDFSDNWRELETMAGTGTENDYLRVQGVAVQDEMFVWSVGVQAHDGGS